MGVNLLDYYQNTLEQLLEKLNLSTHLLKSEVIELFLTRDALSKVLSTQMKTSATVLLRLAKFSRGGRKLFNPDFSQTKYA